MKNNEQTKKILEKIQILKANRNLISLTKNYGGTGCIEQGEPRTTTIEIYYTEDKGQREWFVKKTHQYLTITPSYQTVTMTKESSQKLDESYVQSICEKLESMNLESHKGFHTLKSVPEVYLSKWNVVYGENVYISYTDGYEPECIKELKELLGFELTEMFFMNNVYTEIENPSSKEFYGQRFGLLDSKRKGRK